MSFRLLPFILFFCFSAIAVEIPDLYQSDVLVSDKTRQSRIDAGQEAFVRVVKKLTGQEDVKNHPLIKQAMRDYSQYLTKYEYVEHINGELSARFVFEEEKLNQLIKDANWPFWGNRRPQLVLWLAIEDNAVRDFVTRENYPQLERLIYDKAEEWGLPVLVPLLDLQDRLQVGVAEVWGYFSEPVELASKRYGAERVITARLFQQEGSSSWLLEWRYTNSQNFEPEQRVGDKQVIIAQMMDTLARSLLAEYSIAFSEQNVPLQSVVTVRNLNSFTDITLAKRRLQSISSVKDVDVYSRAGNTVEFTVKHVSSVLDLKKALSFENAFNLYIAPSVFYHVENDSNLIYEWVGK